MAATAVLLATVAGLSAAAGNGGQSDCRPQPLMLWGDGWHDDTAALNAWFAGARVLWAQSGKPVGREISGRVFDLSAALYVPSGTGRTIRRFRFVWPWTHEVVTGGLIATGTKPAAPPIEQHIRRSGGDPSEGIPYRAPVSVQPARLPQRACLTS